MPVPKTALKAGKNALPARRKSQEPTEEPAQLELVPQATEEAEVAPEPILDPAEGILITVKSCKLKESTKRRGNSVYRSCTGKDASGKGYWWGIELDDAELAKGTQVIIKGTLGSPFGKDDDPLHPFKKLDSITPYEEAAEAAATPAKVSKPADDELVQIVAGLKNEYGLSTLLRALAELTN
jgi:hypothetical protein